MRPGRPTPLELIERDLMTQLPTSRADNRKSAAQMLDLARGFQQSALGDIAADRPLPATSSFHEAARIAITAVATANGRRFTNTSGHEAAVDYALDVGIVNTTGSTSSAGSATTSTTPRTSSLHRPPTSRLSDPSSTG